MATQRSGSTTVRSAPDIDRDQCSKVKRGLADAQLEINAGATQFDGWEESQRRPAWRAEAVYELHKVPSAIGLLDKVQRWSIAEAGDLNPAEEQFVGPDSDIERLDSRKGFQAEAGILGDVDVFQQKARPRQDCEVDLPDLNFPAECGLQCALNFRPKGGGVDIRSDDSEQQKQNDYRKRRLDHPPSKRADK